MAYHDQRFKNLLREFFADFFRLFFPDWAERFDFGHIEWLDKEVFADPPRGDFQLLDVVAKLTTLRPVPPQRPDEKEGCIALIHVEVEHRDSVTPLRARMHEYYEQLRKRHNRPVLPIALYLNVGLDGVGEDVYEEYFWEFLTLRFKYLYVGLPALAAETYVAGDHWLGVALAALMEIAPERRAWLKAEALRRLVQSPVSRYQRFLLCECVDAYLPLDSGQQQAYQEILANPSYQGVQPMAMSLYEQMVEKEREKIEQERQRFEQERQRFEQERQRLEQERAQYLGVLTKQLETRFGPLPRQVHERLQALSPDERFQIGFKVFTVQSLKELGLEE